MAMEIITAYQGKPHVTSADVGAMQQGIFGVGDYVLNVGKKMAATLVTNNNIKIDDGEAVIQGRHFRIKPDTYENVTIDNGAQGMKRKDLIVARYTKNASDGVENVELAVLKGTPTSGTPVSPVPVKGDIRAGALKDEMILYTVELNGLNVVGVEPAFYVLMSMEELAKEWDKRFIIGEYTTSKLNEWNAVGQLPSGLTTRNSVIIGYTSKCSDGGWRSNAQGLMVYSTDNGVIARATDSLYASMPIKILFMKFA